MNEQSQAAVIALGSNLCDPIQNVLAAMDRLEGLSDKPLVRSTLWRSSPVECPPDVPDFINAVVLLTPRHGETPESLLSHLQAIEREFGRQPKKLLNESRPLDLDLIVFGGDIRGSPDLTLPHPRAHLRLFVLRPLCEIAPQMVFPGQDRTVAQMLRELPEDASVIRCELPGG